MLFTIAAIFFIAWLLGLAVFKVAGVIVHLLLVLAVVAVLWRLIRGKDIFEGDDY